MRGLVNPGDTIQIATRAGKTWTATVGQVLWTGDGVTLVSTSSGRSDAGRPAHRRRATRTGCSCGSVEEFEKPTDCWTCQHDR